MKSDIVNKFEDIYEEQSDAIFRFSLVRVSGRETALDITQETFLRFWQSLSKGEEIHNERAFLFTIAHRLIIDWYRKKKSVPFPKVMYEGEEIEYDPVDEQTLEVLGLGAEARYLLSKIDELPAQAKDPVYLRFVEGLSPPEIGKVLGISGNAASVRVNRGLVELRKKTGYDNKNGKVK